MSRGGWHQWSSGWQPQKSKRVHGPKKHYIITKHVVVTSFGCKAGLRCLDVDIYIIDLPDS